MIEKPSNLVGTGKDVRRIINHPWFVGIAGSIILGMLFAAMAVAQGAPIRDDVSLLLYLLMGSIVGSIYYALSINLLGRKSVTKGESTPGERIQQSILKLRSASQEVDTTVLDIVQDIKQRESMLQDLENKYQDHIQQELELSRKVEMLKDLPIEVAEYFQTLSEQSLLQIEKRRTKRDVLFFILGILFTIVIALLL